MKIVEENFRVGQLKPGDVFKYGDDIYMRVSEEGSFINDHYFYLCFNLTNNKPEELESHYTIKNINATLYIR